MKVALNQLKDGIFSLSYDAVAYMAQLGSDHAREDILYHERIDGDLLRQSAEGTDLKATAIYDGTTDRLPAYSRHDPYLIQAVEDLGSLANGLFTRLELFIAPDDMDYFIDSYDGVETIRQRVAVSLKRQMQISSKK